MDLSWQQLMDYIAHLWFNEPYKLYWAVTFIGTIVWLAWSRIAHNAIYQNGLAIVALSATAAAAHHSFTKDIDVLSVVAILFCAAVAVGALKLRH